MYNIYGEDAQRECSRLAETAGGYSILGTKQLHWEVKTASGRYIIRGVRA